MVDEGDTIAVWFSCGAASAVALKLTKQQYDNIAIVRAVYNPVAEEDEDNLRFMRDVSEWAGVKIEIAPNFSFPDNSADTVWRTRRYMSGTKGAPCTGLLKKEARRTWEDLNWPKIEEAGKQLHHVFGFTNEEKDRHEKRVNDGMNVLPVLIDRDMSKQDCFDLLRADGLIMPRVYSMASRFGDGFPNANCIGCVKATSPTYWNHVRETHPHIFKARSVLSRQLGCKLVRVKGERLFLDELPPDARGRSMKTMKIDCGIFCGKDD